MAKKTRSTRPASPARKKSAVAKTASRKTAPKKAVSKKAPTRRAGAGPIPDATGKHLVIVESPAKARTINRYLGDGYIVRASVGHIRDLPSRAPKGDKSPVPGVDLEHGFTPHYEVMPDSKKVVTELKRAAKQAAHVWFATDLDREGEAIAWHLAQELGVAPADAKRVVFNAITKEEIKRAFSNPHPIDVAKVNAQQARRILDRIVGYQVSPLLWKKVARGLSAGRVQSVAVRLIVERERDIRSFIPDEAWRVSATFTPKIGDAPGLADAWASFLSTAPSSNKNKDSRKDPGPTLKDQAAWLAKRGCLRAELVEVAGAKFDIGQPGPGNDTPADLTPGVAEIARLAGLKQIETTFAEDETGRGPARFVRGVAGVVDPKTPYAVESVETKRTMSRPSAPFITSTLQQAASSRLGFNARRTMRVAQQLYEGVDVPGEGAVGLITYMRTDSTHLSKDAIESVRSHISSAYGPKYLPEKPNFFGSSNKQAQEAHEAVRPTDVSRLPERVRRALTDEQARLYQLIWERFVACQMTPAQWDSTAVRITGGTDAKRPVTFRATGRVLVFDGFLRVAGVPASADEQTLPALAERAPLAPFSIDPEQKFTSPPPRYTEASLVKTLESEGIGRPSTYASIIQVIQDRKYAEQIERRFYSTDLGEVVTDKLIEAFPEIMQVGYTRDLESDLDKIEDEHTDWVELLTRFYGPFKEKLDRAHEDLSHAKAETTPAPAEYKCEKCGAGLVYRFGKNGRFLSCSRYPDCDFAQPCDREGKPQPIQHADVACHLCGRPMTKRTGRFGPFYGCSGYPECQGILKADKKTGRPIAPQPPPLETDLPCTKCNEANLVLRGGARGPWLSCSRYPKCRGRGKWTELTDEVKAKLEAALAAHEQQHPIPIIRDLSGKPLTDAKGKPLPEPDDDTGDDLDAAERSAA